MSLCRVVWIDRLLRECTKAHLCAVIACVRLLSTTAFNHRTMLACLDGWCSEPLLPNTGTVYMDCLTRGRQDRAFESSR